MSLLAALRHEPYGFVLNERRVTPSPPGSRRHFGTVPSRRQVVFGTSFVSRQLFPKEVDQFPIVSATSMIQIGRDPSGTRVAITCRNEWREVDLWIAEGGIDGNGAGGYTTAID